MTWPTSSTFALLCYVLSVQPGVIEDVIEQKSFIPLDLLEIDQVKKSIEITEVKLGHLLFHTVNIFDYKTQQGLCVHG